MKAPEIQQQCVIGPDGELLQAKNITLNETGRDTRTGRPAARGGQRPFHHIDTGHVPAVPCKVDAVGSGAAAKVKRATRRQGGRPLNKLHQV
jgi:hypothetical protein